MPTFTMAATQSAPRLTPQGALVRPGMGVPFSGKLPFRTLVGRHPAGDGEGAKAPTNYPPPPVNGRQSAIRSTFGLTHSKSAPGFFVVNEHSATR